MKLSTFELIHPTTTRSLLPDGLFFFLFFKSVFRCSHSCPLRQGSILSKPNSTTQDLFLVSHAGRFPPTRSSDYSTYCIDLLIPVPIPRSGHRIVASEEYLYCIGGFNPGFFDVQQDRNTFYPLFKEVSKFFTASLPLGGHAENTPGTETPQLSSTHSPPLLFSK